MELFKKRSLPGWVGVELRPEGVGVVHVARRQPGELPLVNQCGFAPVPKGEKDISEVLAEMVKSKKLQQGNIVTLLDHDRYTVFPMEAPQVPPEELNTTMRWRIKDRLDFPVTEAVVETFAMPMTGGVKSSMVYVVAARAGEITELAERFHATKLKLAVIDIMELGLRNLAALHADDARGVGVLYLGTDWGMVLIVKDGQLILARRLSVGLDNLVNSVRELENSEEVAFSPVLDTIALEAQRTLDYYESRYGHSPVGSLQLVPMGVSIAKLDEILSDRLGVSVAWLPLRQLVELAPSVGEITDAELARCIPALGAALRPVGTGG